MLDAVRIAGRWVCRQVLARLTQRSATEQPPPTRRELVKAFCRAADWHDPQGRPCLSSAGVALRRLERLGLVRLPPPEFRRPRHQPRQLRDDGLPLPPLPRLPRSVEQIEHLRLLCLSGADDPLHGVWNRLIRREHPLGGAPLVGRQLRYLVLCGPQDQQNILGAVGFGPAAWHLECRDRWIGWESDRSPAQLSRVIGLARFLLRPGLRCANLASRCYRQVLDRVADDWEKRYGVRPVLVESFVDRDTHRGVSLAAANWLRLGHSQGRGRSSPSPRVRPRSVKDVWVYPLSRRARAILQAQAPPPLAPRSVFRGLDPDQGLPWTEQELDGLDLGSRRLERRVAQLLAARWQKPAPRFTASFDPNATKAAYRFLNNPQAGVSFARLLAPHACQSARRMAAEAVVVLAQDTTTLSYNTLDATTGLGPVGTSRQSGRGLLLHSLHAFRTDGIPLGCLWAKPWARPPESDTAHRNAQAITDKESERWIEGYQSARTLARSMPGTRLVVCGDRESDLFELFDQTEDAPPNLQLLVRAQHDRRLPSGASLWESLGAQPCGGLLEVRVPRRTGQPARLARLELRWSTVEFSPPQVPLKQGWPSRRLGALLAREPAPPDGVEPIEWMLLGDGEIASLKHAVRWVRWYALRWGIECWHQVLKDVCGVETRQLKSARALERALVFDMIIAWRARLLSRLARQTPDQPASGHYGAEELAVLEAYRPRLPRWTRVGATPAPAPAPDEASEPAAPATVVPACEPAAGAAAVESATGSAPRAPAPANAPLTLVQANVLVAMLAGYWGRKSDGPPGPRMLALGLEILAELVHYRAIVTPSSPPPSVREPKRKPG